MEKYGNKSPLMKFVHKNTGYIIVGGILAVAIPVYLDYDQKADFFERWTCDMMETFEKGMATNNGLTHDNMNEQEHARFHKILDNECR